MFPCFDHIVGAVPALERYLSLGELEQSTDRHAAEHPEATRDRYCAARSRPAEPRAVR